MRFAGLGPASDDKGGPLTSSGTAFDKLRDAAFNCEADSSRLHETKPADVERSQIHLVSLYGISVRRSALLDHHPVFDAAATSPIGKMIPRASTIRAS